MRRRGFLSPVQDEPGDGQHAGHAGSAHHPAADEQRRDADSLQAEHRPDVEVDGLHVILETQTELNLVSTATGPQWRQSGARAAPQRRQNNSKLQNLRAEA